jgi:phosphate transport system protein
MTRISLDYEIQTICDDLLILGSMVENAMLQAVTALRDHDIEKSKQVIHNDHLINKKRYETETEVMITIATQSPVANDLRFLSSSLAICSELERIGDYAKTISKVNIRLGEYGTPNIFALSHKLGCVVVDLLHKAMMSFVLLDAESAAKIIPKDDLCDSIYQKIYSELISFFVKDARNIEYVNNLIWMAHNLERAGDRVTNICERTIYVTTGNLNLESASADGF